MGLSIEDKKMLDDLQKPENKEAYKSFLHLCNIKYKEVNGKIIVTKLSK